MLTPEHKETQETLAGNITIVAATKKCSERMIHKH
jgi:hypothetical protein